MSYDPLAAPPSRPPKVTAASKGKEALYLDVESVLTPDQRERFWARVDRPIGKGACWPWTGPRDWDGYGLYGVWDPSGRVRTTLRAHRVSYQLVYGTLPDDLGLDHYLCDDPGCVRPNHLRPATDRENTLRGNSPPAQNARKTRCLRGHPFNERNTWVRSDGSRACRSCNRIRKRHKRAKRRRNQVAESAPEPTVCKSPLLSLPEHTDVGMGIRVHHLVKGLRAPTGQVTDGRGAGSRPDMRGCPGVAEAVTTQGESNLQRPSLQHEPDSVS